MARRKRPIYAETYRRRRRLGLLVGGAVAIALLALGTWLWQQRRTGINAYAVRGVVLSQTDGSADFQALHSEGVTFAYLKGTQGASYFDDQFATHYEQATGSGLKVGVYHYFSFDSDPTAQAAYFAAKVGKHLGDLPVGLAVSYYGDYAQNPPKAAVVQAKVRAFVVALQRYTTRPVVVMGSAAVLKAVTPALPHAATWLVAERRSGSPAYWQSGTLKAAGASYAAVAFIGTKQAFSKQLN